MSAESGVHQQVQALYQDHHGWLLGWLRKRLGCGHHAADVAQDTFERLLSSRDALLGRPLALQEPRAYLTTTAKRLLVDRARRDTLERAYLDELARATQDLPTAPSPEQLLMAVQALEQICQVLEAVSARARAAFLLHYLDGQPHAVIAEELGVSTRMVHKYLVQVLVQCHSHAS